MDKPIALRAVGFLRKAGPRAFARKCSLAVRNIAIRRRQRAQEAADDACHKARLQELKVVDDHVSVPVLGFTLRLRAKDAGLSRDLIVHGVREKEAVAYLRPLLPTFNVIMEIGANQGYYAILEARETPASARIFAFEPHPANIETLKLNIAENECASKFGEVVGAAVSDMNGTADLNVHKLSNWHSLGAFDMPKGGWQERLPVQTITLDEFCSSRDIPSVDFIRMDVEGHEAAVIDGAQRILRASPRCVMFIEVHTHFMREMGRSPEEFLRAVQSHGFATATACGKGNARERVPMDDVIRNLELLTEEYGNHFFFFKT